MATVVVTKSRGVAPLHHQKGYKDPRVPETLVRPSATRRTKGRATYENRQKLQVLEFSRSSYADGNAHPLSVLFVVS